MNYSIEFLNQFIEDILVFDQKINSTKNQYTTSINDFDRRIRSFYSDALNTGTTLFPIQESQDSPESNTSLYSMEQKEYKVVPFLMWCKKYIDLIEKNLNDETDYSSIILGLVLEYDEKKIRECCENNNLESLDAEEILSSVELKYKSLKSHFSKTKKNGEKTEQLCTDLYFLLRAARIVLDTRIKECMNACSDLYDTIFNQESDKKNAKTESLENTFNQQLVQKEKDQNRFFIRESIIYAEREEHVNKEKQKLIESQNAALNEFLEAYKPDEMCDAFSIIRKEKPDFDKYKCRKDMPMGAYLANIIYDISAMKLCDYTESMLERNFYFIFHDGKIVMPIITLYNEKMNRMFQYHEAKKEIVVKDACNLGMNLFTQCPPGKINFTFIDPVSLGKSFATFMRLVNSNDKTKEVVNGKIWSDNNDIEERLRTITNHISNVTQRCLQGKYKNIFEYNEVAEENAESYQIVMIMDYPAGLSEESLRLIEQIISSGPECGVFTIIYSNRDQYKNIDEKHHPLIEKIQNKILEYEYSKDSNKITIPSIKLKEKNVSWNQIVLPSDDRMDRLIDIIRDGIKNAEKVVIDFENIIPPQEEWFTGDCTSELVIPIGVHGAKNIQSLTFGVGGSHHALIAGQTGYGKSSLLHTIIMSSLIKYPADQLQIFLVDFKRGVEFKIYANYQIESFRVIAIESEKEFGGSVLEFLDAEQTRRAELFRHTNVDNIEDYRKRTSETLPRILLIIDEFQVLFSKDFNDLTSKHSAAYLEQIIRQGRAFGIHVILASQTMSNIGGISNGVWGQVGVRIALKCPEADAKFVLGSENNGVDLLSSDNPGQAVYNSDCGNVTANTVFRVAYIDQEKQSKYLQYISENSEKIGFPETRVMLSNVEDNVYNPFQRFKCGEKVSFENNSILVGEPLKIINNMRMVFRHKANSNMLVIGNDERKARTLFTFALLSFALHKLSENGYKRPEKKYIYLFDYAPMEDFFEKDMLLETAKLLPNYVKYINADDANDVMRELYEDFLQREKNNVEKQDSYMLVYGLQRARDLRSNNVYQLKNTIDDFDEFGSNTQSLSAKPHEIFMNLLQRGAAQGLNSLIWEDNFKVFMSHYSNMLACFDMRIAFTMTDEESTDFIEEPNGSKIGENSAVYSYNGNQKFRPYKKPALEWLKEICYMIENYIS